MNEKHEFLGNYFGGKSFSELLSMVKSENPKDVLTLIEGVEEMIKKNNNITYTQTRNILKEVKKEEFKADLSKFYMVLPKLAYIEARLDKDRGKSVVTFIRGLAANVTKEPATSYENFEEIMNTIVAYLKLYGK